jgi:hypothetical protein
MTHKETRELILQVLDKMVDDLLVNDRKEDPNLPLHAIEEEVVSWRFTIGEMMSYVEARMRERIPAPKD